LVSIELHDGIEANEKSSFEDLSSLCKILFPLRPIRAIDYGAFEEFLGLRTVILNDGQDVLIGWVVFYICSSLERIEIPPPSG